MEMQNLINKMLEEKLISRDTINQLVFSRPPKRVSFGNLIDGGFIQSSKVEDFLAREIRKGVITLSELEQIEDVDTVAIIKLVAQRMNAGYIDLDETDIDIRLFGKLPYAQLVKYRALPIEETEINVLVAFEDPMDMPVFENIQRLFPKKPIIIALSRPSKIRLQLQQLEINESIKGLVEEIRSDLKRKGRGEEDNGDSSAILKLIDVIFKSAISIRASDIHIEATEKTCSVRERVDGMLRQSFIFDKDIFPPLSSRMKLLAQLDIAEKRKPQDGRISRVVNGREFDFRVSSLPTLFGESIVLRILDKSKVMIKLEDAGMSQDCYNKFSEAIKVPYGIVLVTGPTGSGKTTTLYGALNAIRDIKDKTITVEDPVEYQMNGIQQVQVNAQVGLTFASALRSILRQDPDKVMIGEIRDQETLRIAIQAALTGHLVLSTLHTNDAISAVSRILDMGIESYLVSGALVAIQAQRLVRKICPHCKSEAQLPEKVMEEISQYLPENPRFYKGVGCKECQQSGYIGREMISEVLPISEKLKRMIASMASNEEMTKQAESEGFISMFEDGIHKAMSGKTTIDEIFRVARL